MNFIDTLEQDKETTARDALGELAQKSNKQLDTVPAADAEKIQRHPEEDYAQLFEAWLSR